VCVRGLTGLCVCGLTGLCVRARVRACLYCACAVCDCVRDCVDARMHAGAIVHMSGSPIIARMCVCLFRSATIAGVVPVTSLAVVSAFAWQFGNRTSTETERSWRRERGGRAPTWRACEQLRTERPW
jgi:hypothetical protein